MAPNDDEFNTLLTNFAEYILEASQEPINDNTTTTGSSIATTSSDSTIVPSYRPSEYDYEYDSDESGETDKEYCNYYGMDESDDEEYWDEYGLETDVNPYQFSNLNKECFEHCVLVTCNATPLDPNELNKYKKSTIEDLNINDNLKYKFTQITIYESILTPVQQYIIPFITDHTKNLHVSYASKYGAKTGILIGLVNEIQKIKNTINEDRKNGPLAIVVVKMQDSRRQPERYHQPPKDHIVSKIKQLLSHTNMTYAFNRSRENVDILILPVYTFLKAKTMNLSHLAYFCVFDGEIILKQTPQNAFVNCVLEMIKDNVRTIISTNRMSGGQRPIFHDMVKAGSLLIYDPTVHMA